MTNDDRSRGTKYKPTSDRTANSIWELIRPGHSRGEDCRLDEDGIVLIRIDGSAIRPGHAAGVEFFTYGLLNGFAEATEHDIEVEVLRGTEGAWQAKVSNERITWFEVPMALRSDTGLGSHLRRYTPSQMLSSRIARKVVNGVRNRARPVASNGADVTIYPFSCVPARANPSIFVLHDLRRFQAGLRQSGYVDVIRENVSRAAAIAVSWPHPYQQALKIFPEARDKIVMIPLPAFHAKPVGKTSVPEDGLLLYPSSTAPHKNHSTLLAGMAMLPDFRLICPGPLVEPESTKLLARAAEPDIAGRVSFPGFVTVPELTELYRRASAVVVPSTWEAASGAIFEAFSWGLPVACADVAPLRAQVEFAGGEVAYFEPHEPRSVASAVNRLTADREHFAASSRMASLRLAHRTWADTARDYAALVKWVSEESRGPIPQSMFGLAH